jgi:capreomycidine synthase
MQYPLAHLEEWMRRYYFEVDYDIGSSGVRNYSMRELRELLDIEVDELDALVFHDSQTLGGDDIRRVVADCFTGGRSDQVMVTHGSTEANFLIMTTLIEPGDEVLVLDPFYQQLYAIAESRGCRLKRWALPWERDFKPCFDQLAELVTPNTKMIVVNFPHNPTGVSLTPEEQKQLIDAAARVGAYLVWDGAFTHLTYDSEPLPEPLEFYDRAISTGTFSKAYGLPGLRFGWCLAAPEVLEHFVRVRDYTLLHLSPLVEFIAAKALRKADLLIDMRMNEARHNRRLLGDWVAEHSDDVAWVPPMGGVTGFVRFDDRYDVDELCRRLGEEKKVLLVPGSCFGQAQHVRLGFGCATQELEGGLGRLSELL